MAEIVNLRRARKARDRRSAETLAAENRRRHGASKAERRLAEKSEALEAKKLDGHFLGPDRTSGEKDKPDS
jgi:Domain of unknown function (DUF4169)